MSLTDKHKQEEGAIMPTSIFNQTKKKHLKTLAQYVPVVARVHGGNHPEFHDVRQVFEAIQAKIKDAGSSRPDLHAEFSRLRELTHNYNVPGDVCETYAAVYNMLAELDQAYQS